MATKQRIHKLMPLLGRKTAWPADDLSTQQGDYSPNCLNVRFRFGEVRPGPGQGLLAGTVGQQPLWIGQFPQLDGSIWAVMLTTTKAFRWGNSAPGVPRQWHEIQPGDTVPSGTTRWTVAVGEGKMFFGRSDDKIYYWTGTSTDPFRSIDATAGVEGFGGGATAPKAKYLEYFNNRLIVGSTVEGASVLVNRLRWTESGDFRKWDETKQLGAGFLDLAEGGQEPIRGIRSFGSGSRMFAATRRTVKEILATGTTPVHVEQLRVRGIGGDAPYTTASGGQQVFFMGYDRNVYAWNGVNLTAIGEPILEELRELTAPDQMDSYFGIVASQRQEYWIVLPTGDAFIFDYARNYWTRDTVPGFTALGEVDDTANAPSWDQLVGSWNEQTLTWNQLAGQSSTTLFGGRSDGSTSVVDDSVNYDYFSIGSIIDRFVETPDFYVDETGGTKNETIYRLFLNYKFVNDVPFMAGASFDRGVTWHEVDVTPVQAGFNWVDFIATGNTVRFRFREADPIGSFRWRSYTYERIEAGDFLGTTTG